MNVTKNNSYTIQVMRPKQLPQRVIQVTPTSRLEILDGEVVKKNSLLTKEKLEETVEDE